MTLANLRHRNYEGFTPEDIAKQHGHERVLLALKEHITNDDEKLKKLGEEMSLAYQYMIDNDTKTELMKRLFSVSKKEYIKTKEEQVISDSDSSNEEGLKSPDV